MHTDGRLLFICNTYMQLISAVQIKLTLFDSAAADLILSDHSVNCQAVAENLKKTGLFSRVRTVNSKRIMYEQRRFDDIKDVIALVFDYGQKFRSMMWEDTAYRMIFYYNYDPILICAYDQSAKAGEKPVCARFEEGILSCMNMREDKFVGRMKLVHFLRDILGRGNVFEQTEEFYCFYPELLHEGRGKAKKIPLLSRDNHTLVKYLNTAFGYSPEEDDYPQKYIFFASSSDIDGNPVGETELVLKIADMVGRDHLLVKMHPRDNRRIYEERGIAVSRNSSIPWEAIQLNHNFEEHVFLTISSGSVLNASAMLDDEIPTYYLYPMIKGRKEEFDRVCETKIGTTVCKFQQMGMLQKSGTIDNIKAFYKNY